MGFKEFSLIMSVSRRMPGGLTWSGASGCRDLAKDEAIKQFLQYAAGSW